ncbi:MAG TPA: glycosyltransferase family 4 protein [Microthrixaceae bacterium]|nr:glycosyltransferase family 4 protein [Microthrixaceae bacterium]
MTDGVSIVARRWMEIVASFGFDVVTVAGEGPVDRKVPGLAIDAPAPPTDAEIADALVDADLVVVENLCTIPLNVEAALGVARVLAGRPAVMHHHDPPWHRERYAHVTELPIDDPAWRHVTINDQTAAEMAAHGFDTTVIYNGFETSGPGDRVAARRWLGVDDDEVVVAHPVRAIERKNVPAAIGLAEALDATYWLLGPAEEGYGPTLDALLASARCRVIHRACDVEADIYAAADVVAFPSTWEGFGNPPIEAALHRRPAVVGHYPFAAELRALGFRWFDPDDVAGVADFLREPDESLLDANEQLAKLHFSMGRVRDQLHTLFDDEGWLS